MRWFFVVGILDFPIKYNEKNLVFSNDGSVSAVYEIAGFGYDWLSHTERFQPFMNQLIYLQSQKGRDLQYLSVPQADDVTKIVEDQIERLDFKASQFQYDLVNEGKEYNKIVGQVLKEHSEATEKREYRSYVVVQLNRKLNRYHRGNKGTDFLTAIKEFFVGLNSDVNRAVGLDAADILRDEIKAYAQQALSVMNDLKRAFTVNGDKQIGEPVRPLQTAETIRLIEMMYSSTMSFRDVKYRRNFIAGEEITAILDGEEKKAVRPNRKQYYPVQESYIDELDPKTLVISKEVAGKMETVYSRMYVITKFQTDIMDFPGSEWMYHLQKQLPFPIISSLRLHYKDNERVQKELSNVKLEYEDQKKQAYQSHSEPDNIVLKNEEGIRNLQEYFQKTGYPSYENSFVFRINAASEEELNNRCGDFESKMQQFAISVQAPYGLQLDLFMEMLVGSKQINKHYKNETDPRLLAGMMFGAVNAIGDKKGFYIGDTEQGKAVFLYPEEAAKAHEGVKTSVDSISCSIAGATGKGKSVLQNLITYLSVLNGSYALIIDPKGDRRDWAKGIPFIDKQYIDIWELGKNGEHEKGMLDPFYTAPNVEEGRKIATNIFSYLVGANIEDLKYGFLSEAFTYAAKQESACVGLGIAYLQNLHKQGEERSEMTSDEFSELSKLIRQMNTFLVEPFIRLLIAEPGEKTKTLQIDKPLQVVITERLSLPQAGKDPSKYTTDEKISTAVLISLTAFTNQFMIHNDRTRHKIVLQDESSVMDKNDEGRRLLDFIVRQGRYFNTTLLKGSQNASDHGDDIANLGMKFSFALKKREEAVEMLNYFDLPATNENVTRLMNLPRGHCLFQDIYGRTDVLKVNPVFTQVLDAFDTSTSSKEEREFEAAQRNRDSDTTFDDEGIDSAVSELVEEDQVAAANH